MNRVVRQREMVEMILYDGENVTELKTFCPCLVSSYGSDYLVFCYHKGTVTIDIGDWIVKDSNGLFYHMSNDTFQIKKEAGLI